MTSQNGFYSYDDYYDEYYTDDYNYTDYYDDEENWWEDDSEYRLRRLSSHRKL